FAFALGLFAFTQGESSLWLQLVAAQGSVDAEILRSQINYALENLASTPLICIDDVDALDTAGNAEHRALVQLWDSLRPLSTLIVIGRHEQLSSSRLLQLDNLSPAETEQFFTHCGRTISSDDVARYYQWTQGNLRLLHLCCSIFATVPEGKAIPDPSTDALTRRFLLSSLLTSLSETELRVLASLSVFRRPHPLNYPPDSPEFAACRTLQERRILNVTTDGNGEVVAVYRRFVYASLRTGVAQVFHSLAAELRSAYGEYASTIYHLLRAGRFAEAVDLWPNVKRQEMEQGQAGALLAAFRDGLEMGSLPDSVASVLTLYCAELNQFLGNIEQAEVDAAAGTHFIPIFDAELGELKGRIANDLGHFREAKEAFDRALERADLLLEARLAQVHKGLAWMHLRQRDLEHAERELDYAQFEIENMRGNLAYDQARYDDATGHYEAALRLAEGLNSPNAGAKTRLNLAMVYMVQGRYDDSLELLNRVYVHYQTMHRIAAMAGCRITMAVAHNLAGAHKHALACLDDADEKLRAVDKTAPWQAALIAQARAEALLGLGELTTATTHVLSAIHAADMSILPDAYRTYGEILTRQEDWAQAEKYLRQSVALAQKNEDRLLLAYAWRALGGLYLVQSRWDAVRSASNTAITLFESLQLPNEVERTRRMFGR
ncbi:MAG: tetratricopeptide repeat protein, partial [Caldilineaceae bacterium]|nr:tetratricopeptide repeat protein [Caldilineaceae bacterium]